jgi:hypothetical protein
LIAPLESRRAIGRLLKVIRSIITFLDNLDGFRVERRDVAVLGIASSFVQRTRLDFELWSQRNWSSPGSIDQTEEKGKDAEESERGHGDEAGG